MSPSLSNPFPIVFVVYPQVTQLDFTGPFEVFWRLPNAQCILASTTGLPIEGGGGITFTNVQKISEIKHVELLCVPGGFGTIKAMEDLQLLEEIRRLATGARYITSVCTGSLLLGAAGLLRGKRAACHWAWRDLLPQFGAVIDSSRVVRDGNIFSGGGVTAGIDMALSVASEIVGEEFAQAIQLGIEYAPAPPFNCGRPELAAEEIVVRVKQRLDTNGAERYAAVRRAVERLNG